MKHASQIQFGRPNRAVQAKPEDSAGPDKWDLLNNLTLAAEEFELSHRTLNVLKALLTFLPTRAIPSGQGAIVFPSNRTLSARLSGMPESTLRRHLNTLVRQGIVNRHDSPNKKRYARRVGGDLALVYGFDLTPLITLHDTLVEAAGRAQAQAERLAVLRDLVIALRARVILAEGQSALTDEAARLLRRKPDQHALERAEKSLRDVVENLCGDEPVVNKMSVADNQNERHIQNSDKYDLDTEGQITPEVTPRKPSNAENDQSISLPIVTNICKSFQSYFPERIREWRDLVRMSEWLAPMLGIEQPVFHQAKQTMGAERAAVVVLCILEKISAIRNPGAYLRHLTKMAQAGGFSVLPMLNALKSQELSADNLKYV